jgi:hypothetical protein
MASGLVCGWGVEKLVPELVPDTPGQEVTRRYTGLGCYPEFGAKRGYR